MSKNSSRFFKTEVRLCTLWRSRAKELNKKEKISEKQLWWKWIHNTVADKCTSWTDDIKLSKSIGIFFYIARLHIDNKYFMAKISVYNLFVILRKREILLKTSTKHKLKSVLKRRMNDRQIEALRDTQFSLC